MLLTLRFQQGLTSKSYTAEDIALVYAPSKAKVSLPEFRTSALSVGEEVFAEVFLPTGAGVSLTPGKITSLAGDSTIYQNQFQTSILQVRGMSGAPVFDRQGRLTGIISGFTVEPGKPERPEYYNGSNVSRINSVKEMFEVERQKMADCPR
ncbi:trypsin-like peptidase domain-containing protein [Candidatus Woesearchaeota archaeon]|nr:trypsin-like peptidase domain-containing protein [Candidatus Woesearchaeota archaeon]